MAARENASGQQLELDKNVFSQPSSSRVFSKGLFLMLWKNMIERLTQAQNYYQSRFTDDI